MINITVRTIFGMDRAIGSKKVQRLTIDDGSTVKDVIENLSLLYGDGIRDAIMESSKKPKQGISILVNGRNIFAYEGFSYELNDNDEILILPPVGGG